MKRSAEIPWGEYRLGMLIFVAMVLFLWASIQGGSNLFKKQYTLHSHFGNVQGVVAGAPIWFQGVEVGTVKTLDFANAGDSSHVLVTFKVNERVWPLIRRDSRVRIQALNLFGEKFMEVTPGSRGSARAHDGDTLASEPPTDVQALLARGENIVGHLESVTNDLDDTMKKIKRGEGTLGRLTSSDELYVSLKRTIDAAGTLTSRLDESQREMRSSLVAVTGTLDSLARKIDRGDGTLGRLVRDPSLYDNLKNTSSHIDSALGRIDRGEGNLGKLSKDEELYKNLEQSLGRLNEMLTDMQRNPKKYFKFSVF